MTQKGHCFCELQLEEESEFLHAVAIQARQKKFNSTFEENRTLLSSMTGKIFFRNVDKIKSLPFPVN